MARYPKNIVTVIFVIAAVLIVYFVLKFLFG